MAKARADEDGRRRLGGSRCRPVNDGPLTVALEDAGGLDGVRAVLDWGWDEIAAGRLTGKDAESVPYAFGGETGRWATLYRLWLDRPKPKGSSSNVPDEVDGVALTDEERDQWKRDLRGADWGYAQTMLRRRR